ncbi:MAG: glycoside hydrolase family 25 protein [Methanobrevibacter sp.]|nr:glycoside hydrolase family 25 protein [Methanobrevibacter sp.]
MLKGIDISRHNRNLKDPKDLNSLDFVIMKASEGATYRDSSLMFYNSVLDDDMLKGFYHFGRPDNGNSARSEASNFVSSILKYNNDHAILALDLEDKALSVPCLDDWALEFAKYVYSATGKKIMIYCSVSEAYRFKKCAAFDCGLWAAKWSRLKPTKKQIKPFEVFAMWQDTNKYKFSGQLVDHDYFNGSAYQFLKYAGADV